MNIRSTILSAALLVVAAPVSAQSQIDWNLGTPLGAGDDTMSIAPLPFAWTCPCGPVISTIEIDSNGRILPVGADSSDFSPTVVELLADECVLAPAWRDWTFAVGPGDVYFNAHTDRVVVTWHDAQPFPGGAGVPSYTFQATLFSDNSFWFTYCEMDQECLVGYSVGASPDPGASDFSVSPSVHGCSAYESFAAGTFDLEGGGLEFLPNGSGYVVIWHGAPAPVISYHCTATPGFCGAPTLTATTSPGELCVQFTDCSGAANGVLGIRLGPAGVPFPVCAALPFCLTGGLVITKPVTFVGGVATCCFDTCDPAFAGLCLNFQGFVVDPTSIAMPCLPVVATRRMKVQF